MAGQSHVGPWEYHGFGPQMCSSRPQGETPESSTEVRGVGMVPGFCMATLAGVETCGLRSIPGRDASAAGAGGAAGRLGAPCSSRRGSCDGRMAQRVPDMSQHAVEVASHLPAAPLEVLPPSPGLLPPPFHFSPSARSVPALPPLLAWARSCTACPPPPAVGSSHCLQPRRQSRGEHPNLPSAKGGVGRGHTIARPFAAITAWDHAHGMHWD